jgi:Tfp pilus assembly protein PilX
MKTWRQPFARANGVALPVSLIIVAIMLIVSIALVRSSRSDLAASGNEGDRVFATQASDAALKSMLAELQALPAIPEIYDPAGASLLWWNANPAPITGAFWSGCATAAAGARCSDESVTKAGRKFRVQRMVQPNSTPDRSTATSGALAFYYRVAVLVTLETGARAETESYVRKPQIVR